MSFVFRNSGKPESQVRVQRSGSNALSLHILNIKCVRISFEWERNPSEDIGKGFEEDTSTYDSPILYPMHGPYHKDTSSTLKRTEIQVKEIQGLKSQNTNDGECDYGIVNHSDSDATTDDCSEQCLNSSPLSGEDYRRADNGIEMQCLDWSSCRRLCYESRNT